ncbi:MAG: phosphoribosylaminoimidazolesuccinocarboxamide synthase [Patescibacteria group bacterium]
MDIQTIAKTDFKFVGQTAVYHGKVRDMYTIKDKLILSIATDRVSAFDVVLPRAIPYKGQVLNQLAAHFLEKSEDIVPVWLRAVPDPNVSAGLKAEPYMIEMVIRGCLVGHAWREYKAGKREICGVPLPEGLQEYDSFPEPIITPTTKADVGHDEDISGEEAIKTGLVTAEEWQQLSDYTQKLFARGQEMARAQGLVLADTKYEFGKVDGKIILIDEVNTPDSSRYFYADSYDAYVDGAKDATPKHLSKEFLREWLMENGYSGQEGQTMPEMTDEVVAQISDRYLELYEKMAGEKFIKSDTTDIIKRIEANITNYLKDNA